jgi:16S rRNA (uracil1498-N3)-methyltransferase
LHHEEEIILFNGQGGEYPAKLFITKKQATVHILGFTDINREGTLKIHLAQGLARGDRMDFIVQKATELGVTSITPLFTKNCAVKLDEMRATKRLQHWQNIAISAAEQCGRTTLPLLFAPMTFTEWVKQPFAGLSIVFDINSQTSLKTLKQPSQLRVAIGPESGWDNHENALMISQGFLSASLGPRILRTETASIAALSIIQGLFGDLN